MSVHCLELQLDGRLAGQVAHDGGIGDGGNALGEHAASEQADVLGAIVVTTVVLLAAALGLGARGSAQHGEVGLGGHTSSEGHEGLVLAADLLAERGDVLDDRDGDGAGAGLINPEVGALHGDVQDGDLRGGLVQVQHAAVVAPDTHGHSVGGHADAGGHAGARGQRAVLLAVARSVHGVLLHRVEVGHDTAAVGAQGSGHVARVPHVLDASGEGGLHLALGGLSAAADG